ncbi:MAG: inositol 2-dehydrogenase [Myxococcaceae bacterium]|nr:inositol 2-dehydrogenase [Myxococcaceae bacterium]
MNSLELVLFGAGRIGQIHGANAAAHPRAKLRWVVDPNLEAATALAKKFGAKATTSPEEALADKGNTAAIIASSTNTHVELLTASSKAGLAIFCEKPIDNSLERVDLALAELSKSKVPFFIAFNRRFDPSFAALRGAVKNGDLGQVETVIITSRDPSPPPIAYVKVSGGLFRDMMIHDLDMARWLLPEEPVQVFAQGSALVDPAIGQAGDVDTAVVSMKTKSGVLCQISNSRRAVYGYDQRIEVHGAKGMLQAGNLTPTSVVHAGAAGVVSDKPLHFFLERYQKAYQAEMEHFVTAILDKKPLSTGAEDGRRALVLAEAAMKSLEKNAPVTL